MSNEPRATVAYSRTKISALQQLATGGDVAALRELERRGIAPTVAIDVTTLDAAALCHVVAAWADGQLPDDRTRNRALAEHAHAELQARYRTDVKLYTGRGAPPVPPLPAPWLAPRPRRCEDWRRPEGSTLYPSETDQARASMAALARDVFQQRNH